MTVIIGEILDTIRDFQEALTVTRPTTETVVDGYVIPGTQSVVGVSGHMQPMSDKERRYVPEGMNTLEWWNVWTLSAIQEGDLVSDSSGSPVITIVKFKHWREGPFWHGQGVLVDDNTKLPPTSVFVPAFSSAFS